MGLKGSNASREHPKRMPAPEIYKTKRVEQK